MNFEWFAIAAAIGLLVLLGAPLAWFYDALDTYAEIVAIARDIIVTLVAVVGAVWGLGEWKRQFNAKNEHELARRVLRAAHHLKEVMHALRGPIWDIKSEDLSKDYFKEAYEKRYAHLGEALLSLHTELSEAVIFWGSEDGAVKSVESLLRVGRKQESACQTYFSTCHNRERPERNLRRLEFCEKQKAIIVGCLTDEFGKKIGAAFDEVDKQFRPKLRP